MVSLQPEPTDVMAEQVQSGRRPDGTIHKNAVGCLEPAVSHVVIREKKRQNVGE